jgi:aryl-alcohol dehydrogenase-like predicted oxidoreductase
MRSRTLGTSLVVSEQGLGCMGMSHVYGPANEDNSRATLRRALELGITFFDTADIYGPYVNEELITSELASVRDDVIIATKFGHEVLPDSGGVRINGRPEYVRAACDASLSRLGTDYIDLYYQHRVDRNVPIEETWGAMKELVDAGKVRHLGISEAAPDTIRRAHAVHPMTAIQSEYSLWTRDVEDNGVLAMAAELNIGFVPFSPMGRGFFAGGLTNLETLSDKDLRRGNPRFQGENLNQNLAGVRTLQVIAESRGVLPTQLALAWVLAQGSGIVPIPGTTHVDHLEQNVDSGDLGLTAADLSDIEAAFPKGATAGPRYTDMSNIYL